MGSDSDVATDIKTHLIIGKNFSGAIDFGNFALYGFILGWF